LRGHSDDPRLPKDYPDPSEYRYLEVPQVQLAKGECGNPARLLSHPAIIDAMMNATNSGVVCVRVHEEDDVMGLARQFNHTDQQKFREEKMETYNATVKEVKLHVLPLSLSLSLFRATETHLLPFSLLHFIHMLPSTLLLVVAVRAIGEHCTDAWSRCEMGEY